jgi:predicted O-methyltransferase YrrM
MSHVPRRTVIGRPHDREELNLHKPLSDASGQTTLHNDFARLLCRALSARTVVELQACDGATTAALAGAVQATEGRLISIGEPSVLNSIDQRLSVEALAGVAELVAVDSVEPRLSTVPAEIDVVFVTPPAQPTERFLALLSVLTARLRNGGVLFSSSRVAWYAAYVRDPAHGFRTSLSPLGAISLWSRSAKDVATSAGDPNV